MSETYKYTINDLIKNSVDQKPIEFENAFNQIVTGKIEKAVNDLKVDVAKSMFNQSEEETTEEE